MLWKNELINLYPNRLKLNFSLKMKSSLRTGGHCECFLEVGEKDEILHLLQLAKKEGFSLRVLGRGSNTLIADGLIKGLVIQGGAEQNKFTIEGEEIVLGASIYLSKAIQMAHSHGLIGLEFAVGIPGTIGGAVVMNAGTKLGKMADVVKDVTLIHAKGISIKKNRELDFSYRHSSITDDAFVHNVRIALKKANDLQLAFAKKKLKEYLTYRSQTQPLSKPNLGSTFINPPGHFAAKLVESCGLKGFAVGGIHISKLHANFIINDGQGTSTEAWNLIQHIMQKVKEKTNIQLTPEIRLFGF